MKKALSAGDMALWGRIREMQSFTVPELARLTGYSRNRFYRLVRYLEAQGVVRVAGRDADSSVRYKVDRTELPKTSPEAEAPGGSRSPAENMWTAMRGLANFSALDLSVYSSTEAVNVTQREAQKFCRFLEGAGYLRQVRKAIPGRQLPYYKLIRNTGPRPPRECRITVAFDDNLNRWVNLPGEGR
ncbi:hypothetical protein T8T21_00830 [Limimaricola variabilis]|uniref:hypothetical protein n=1 Tax=Limimaricola variabilis TaxID=1492771 RepID=UPI002AC9BB85|nr:hypothetical protein [Limimaricola variabilis]WPY94703.1 hypothetical protein T8T21_00830 [Limimaricola variabilis]